jgi:small-conductance mechanosensitive channel
MTVRRLLLLSFIVLAGGAGSVRLHAQPQGPAAAPEADVATVPVVIDGTALFRVRGVSSYPAEARASAVEERIVSAAANPAVDPASLRLVEGDGALRIMAADRVIMAVVDADAVLEGVSRADLARAHLQAVRGAIAQYRDARSTAALRRDAMRTATATLLLAAAIGALLWFWRWFSGLVRRRVQARIHTVGIQSFEVMRADRIRAALQSAMLAVRVVAYLAIALIYMGFVLGQWPWTRGLSHGVAGFVLDPLRTMGSGLLANIPRFAFLAVLFLVVRVTLRVIRLFFEAVGRGTVTLGGFDAEWAQPTYKIVRVAVIACGIIVAYPYIPGSQSEAFKGVSLFIGIVFSLGSSAAISNVIAGCMMTYRRAFKVGDRIKIGDSVGEVIETRLQVTHLRSPKNEEIVIPNSQILGGEVLNYSSLARERGLLLHTDVGIGYDTPWRQVESMLLAAAARTPGLGARPEPFVLIKRLGDFAVSYELNVPCSEVVALAALYSSLHQNILDVFNEHGVQIMVPAYEGDPPEPKVVPPERWHEVPATVP